MSTLKSFAPLHDDYAFFESHATEGEASLAALLPLVQGRWQTFSALDFGAGSGSFTSTFLQRAAFPPERFSLTLVEPDSGFREKALVRLAPFSASPLQAWPLLDRDVPPLFDLIFSHHVLYYVPDLHATVRRLHQALLPGGRMLVIQGGKGNGMNRLVWSAFDRIGERAPYNYSEATRTILQDLKASFTIQPVSSVLDFPDSPEGRMKILRFLLSEHLTRLPAETALGLFEPFRVDDRIRIESHDDLFVVEAGG